MRVLETYQQLGPPPRAVQISADGRGGIYFLCGLLLALLALAGVMMFLFTRDRRQQLRMMRGDARTEGKIVGAEIRSDRSQVSASAPPVYIPVPYLDYTFEAGGRAYKGHSAVSESLYKEVRIGQPITVYYDPKNPDRAQLRPPEDVAKSPRDMTIFAIAGLLLTFFIGAAVWGLFSYTRTLKRDGVSLATWHTATGRIVKMDPPNDPREKQTEALVELHLPQQAPITGRVSVNVERRDGESVPVLYNPQNPSEFELLEKLLRNAELAK